MTTVHVSMARDDGTGTLAAVAGSLYWEPTTRREDGTVVVLPVGFAMNLVAGEATKDVEPSGLTWCWRVTERVQDGTVRYVSVPDSAETVEYVDLPDVDPTTLVEWSPADPEAAYLAALADLDVAAAVETYLLANPVTAPVDSVNAQTGVVVLDAADVGAVAPADLATVATSGDYNDLSNRPTFKTVSNQTGAPIAADTLVEISGAFGIFVTVRVADNSTADHVAGITTAEIADGATGEIQVTGEVTGLNTSALTAGTPLYLSTSGGWTDTRPTAPAHVIRVGVAGVTHPTAGTIVFTLPSYEVLADNVDGLGDSATLDIGTTAGTVAAGDHTHAELHTHANAAALDLVSGTNTGDQDLSGYSLTTHDHAGVYAPVSHEHTATDVDAGASLDGQVLTSDGAGNAAWETPASGVTDHGLLSGLADDDHTQYALADGTRGSFAAPLGADDNYVTDAQLVVIGNTSGINTGDEVAASDTVAGVVELATTAETTTGTDTARAVTPAGVKAVADTLTPAVQTINAQTGTTYTLVAADASKLVTCTNAAAITVTLPQDSAATFAVGSRVDFAVLGAGMVTFAADAGSTVNGTPSLVTRAQYSAATAIKRAADTWLVVGDLATP